MPRHSAAAEPWGPRFGSMRPAAGPRGHWTSRLTPSDGATGNAHPLAPRHDIRGARSLTVQQTSDLRIQRRAQCGIIGRVTEGWCHPQGSPVVSRKSADSPSVDVIQLTGQQVDEHDRPHLGLPPSFTPKGSLVRTQYRPPRLMSRFVGVRASLQAQLADREADVAKDAPERSLGDVTPTVDGHGGASTVGVTHNVVAASDAGDEETMTFQGLALTIAPPGTDGTAIRQR